MLEEHVALAQLRPVIRILYVASVGAKDLMYYGPSRRLHRVPNSKPRIWFIMQFARYGKVSALG